MTITDQEHDEETFLVSIVSKAYHADLLKAVREFGSIAKFADYLGVNDKTIGDWIALRSFPKLEMKRKGKVIPNYFLLKKWPKIARKLCELTGKTIQQLFPGFVRLSGLLEQSKVKETVHEITAGQLLSAPQPIYALPSPEHTVNLNDWKEKLSKWLGKLSHRSREVLKLRFGLDGNEQYSFEEVGRIFKISKERVRQIEIKAMRQLEFYMSADGDKSRIAEELLDMHPCPLCNEPSGCFDSCRKCEKLMCRKCYGDHCRKCKGHE